MLADSYFTVSKHPLDRPGAVLRLDTVVSPSDVVPQHGLQKEPAFGLRRRELLRQPLREQVDALNVRAPVDPIGPLRPQEPRTRDPRDACDCLGNQVVPRHPRRLAVEPPDAVIVHW